MDDSPKIMVKKPIPKVPEKNSIVSILIRNSHKSLAYLGLVPNQPQTPAGIVPSVIKHEVKVK